LHFLLFSGGGTTWDGTLIKLLSPGLLLHHETPTRDWFYDEMKPHVHYIPLKTDLSDLKYMYDWVEENPVGSELIAKQATRFAESMLSTKYMAKVYKELFVDYLGKVVSAYQPSPGISWSEMEQQYRDSGHEIIHLSACGDKFCHTEGADKVFKQFRHRQKTQ
jgi:hypothetical protein